MKNQKDLTRGSIVGNLWNMSVPLMLASFVQITYSLADMLWLGRLGSEAVAAVGAAGFFIWISNSVSLITKIGAEITISQSVGAKDRKKTSDFTEHNINLSIIIGVIYTTLILLFSDILIGLFGFEKKVAADGVEYLKLVTPGIFFIICNNTFSGLYNGNGDTATPFKIILIGLILNICLDPILIYGRGGFPKLGVGGAAIATSFSQLVVFVIFLIKILSSKIVFGKPGFILSLKREYIKRIFYLGTPAAAQNASFAVFSLILATLAASWGPCGVAVQSIGGQVEAVTWMTAAGFSTALGSFIGQNFGARKYDRILRGYKYTMFIAGSIGLISGIVFFIFGATIFSFFVPEPESIKMGENYMKILAFSQVFMSTEMVTAGAFNGCGRTVPPALSGILFTGLRIPMAYYFSSLPQFGINGIWLSITVSSILKGTVLPSWFLAYKRRLRRLLFS